MVNRKFCNAGAMAPWTDPYKSSYVTPDNSGYVMCFVL